MQTISMLQLRKMCEAVAPVVYSFDMANQKTADFSSVQMTAVFPTITMMFNPNRICLKNESGTICFNRVKSITHYDDAATCGMLFGIVCGNAPDHSNKADCEYKIFVDKNYGSNHYYYRQ